MMKFIGRHLTVDMYGCSFENLNSLDYIKEAMAAAVKDSNTTLLDFSSYKFEPHGLTAMALLAESHLNIHTYPELGYAAVDIFTAGDQGRPDMAIAVLKRFLKPERMKITNIRRGDFGTESDMKPKIKTSAGPLTRVRSTSAKVLHFLSRRK